MQQKLAIEGGNRVISPNIYLKNWPIITEEDIYSILEVVKQKDFWGIEAKKIVTLEKEYARYLGLRYCVALNSGTAALHAAIAAIGVGPGDEVLVPALTFVSSATSVLHHLGIPVFVDIDPDTFDINPHRIEEKISEKTKAIVVVHYQGLPADMDEINTIAQKYNLLVVEDAAQSHGSTYKGKKVGAIGHIGACSIMPIKNLPAAGEGGLLTTNNTEYFKTARMIREFGEGISPSKRKEINAKVLGWNYRMSPLCAAMACEQLKRLTEYTHIRQQRAQYLSEELSKLPGIKPPYVPDDRTHSYHIYRFRVDAGQVGLNISNGLFRMALYDILSTEGVPVRHYHSTPVPGHKVFQDKIGYGKGCPWECPHARRIEYTIEDYPETLKVIEDSLVIMGHNLMGPEEIPELYIEAFRKVFSRLDYLENYAKKIIYTPPWESID